MPTKKTLYVKRDLRNGKELIEWARSAGFKDLVDPESLHVTIAFSNTKVEWEKFRTLIDTDLFILPSQPRQLVALDHNATALNFDSFTLKDRWQHFKDNGASWDYPTYIPHISLSFAKQKIKLNKIEPFSGDLIFGPEIWETVNIGGK